MCLKRIFFVLTSIILISAFMISVSADYINTFQFIQNLSFTTQTNVSLTHTSVIKPALIAEDDKYTVTSSGTDSNGNPVDYSYPFIAYGFRIYPNTYPTDIEYTEITIPFNLNLQAGASIKIPFIFATNRVFSISNSLGGSYFNLGSEQVPFTQSNISTNSIIGYINNVYNNVFTVKDTVSEWNNSQYLYLNLGNNTNYDIYISSITIRINSDITVNNEQILFPFIYEGDELISYTAPNPYNIPKLTEISGKLTDIAAALTSGNQSVGSMLADVLSDLQSLDTNVGAIDTNVTQIVQQLSYLVSLDSSNASINSTLTQIRLLLSQYFSSNAASGTLAQDIIKNYDYLEDQKPIINQYDNAGNDKKDIYNTTTIGLTSSGGTYDRVDDLVSSATSTEGFTDIFGLIFGNSIIQTIMLSVISIGTVSYILYGKR